MRTTLLELKNDVIIVQFVSHSHVYESSVRMKSALHTAPP